MCRRRIVFREGKYCVNVSKALQASGMEAITDPNKVPISSISTELHGIHQLGDRKTADIQSDHFNMEQLLTFTSRNYILANESCITRVDSDEKVKIPKTDMSTENFEPFSKSGFEYTINKDNVNDLLQLADKYQVKNCMIQCIQFLKEILNVENVCFVLDVAWNTSWMVLAAIHGNCINIVYEHFDVVIKTSGFSSCRASTIQTVLSQHPSNRCEFNVFDAVVKWARNSCTKSGIDSKNPFNLRKIIGANFNLIDFEAMTEIDFFTCQLEHRLLSSREVNEIVNKMCRKR